jgi:hypothetical protein
MKINDYEFAIGVVTTQAIPEGRMVLLTSHSEDLGFGSGQDLPGVKLPTSATEAAKAKYVITFAQDSRQFPAFAAPSMEWALRYGFDKTDNTPFSATVYATNPSVQEGLTIPEGSLAVAFSEGVFTVPSGAFIYSSSLVPGAGLTVNYTGADAGKLQYGTSNLVAEVITADTTKLTFKLL